MTFSQASEHILNKAVSLKTGWKQSYESYLAGVTRHYINDALPGVFLYHQYQPGTKSISVSLCECQTGGFIINSDELTVHMAIVQQSILDEEKLAHENRIIEIAKKLGAL